MQGGNSFMSEEIFIIAEAGVNHNGDLLLAKKLVEAAAEAHANAVKFQTFKTEKLVSVGTPKANYQSQTTGDGGQFEMLKKLELSEEDHYILKKHAEDNGIIFLSTAFDMESVDLLEKLDMPVYKVPSGEINNVPLLLRIAQTGKPVILSTGMCTLDEVGFSVELLRRSGVADLTLLQCNTQYPTPYKDANILAMKTMGEKYHTRYGYSDHTLGIEVPIAAAALGACVIEKHFTLDNNLPGPDHKASLEPKELKRMVEAIRNVENALGTGMKTLSESEKCNVICARKSIVAAQTIKCGELLNEKNITVKRPAGGIPPSKWFEVIGRTAKKDYEMDEMIER
jgi:N,N'-diacetyllegionaminate synthase